MNLTVEQAMLASSLGLVAATCALAWFTSKLVGATRELNALEMRREERDAADRVRLTLRGGVMAGNEVVSIDEYVFANYLRNTGTVKKEEETALRSLEEHARKIDGPSSVVAKELKILLDEIESVRLNGTITTETSLPTIAGMVKTVKMSAKTAKDSWLSKMAEHEMR